LLAKAQDKFRGWFARVWQVRGGGFYAFGWAVTFIWYEVTSVLEAIADAEGVIDFLRNQLLEFLLRFLGDSFVNMVHAFLWPLHIVQWRPPAGFIAIGVGYVVFAAFIKQRITAWLFPSANP